VTAAPAGGGLAEVLAVLAKATPGRWETWGEPTHDDPSTKIAAGNAFIATTLAGNDSNNAAAIIAAVNYLRSHGEAIGELIEADKEYDEARKGYIDHCATPEQIDRLSRAELRRRAALAKVASNGDTK